MAQSVPPHMSRPDAAISQFVPAADVARRNAGESAAPIWMKCQDCGVYLYKSGPNYGSCIVCGKGYSLEVSGPRIGSLN